MSELTDQYDQDRLHRSAEEAEQEWAEENGVDLERREEDRIERLVHRHMEWEADL